MEVLQAKEHPRKHDYQQGNAVLQPARKAIQGIGKPALEQYPRAMHESPKDKVGACAVPQTGDEEHNTQIQIHPPSGDTTAAKWDVHIVSEPGGQ